MIESRASKMAQLFVVLMLPITVIVSGGTVLLECPSARAPEGGNAVERLLEDGTRQTIFSCSNGRRLRGRKIATCILDQWDVPTPECVLYEQRDLRLDLYVGDDPSLLLDTVTKSSRKKNRKHKHAAQEKKRRNNRPKNSGNKRRKNRNGNLRLDESPLSEAPVITSESGLNETTAARLDLSCFMKARGKNLVKAPTVKYTRPPKYERRKNGVPPYNRYLVAVYQCQDGYGFRDPGAKGLYCSDGSWLGELPECVNEKELLGPMVKRCGQERGGCEQMCEDTETGFVCSCFDGFRAEGYSCLDIDECADGTAGCEDKCRNEPGTFHCECSRSGYQLNIDGKSCQDINECLSNNGHGLCQGKCVNFDGGYQCSCDDITGHRLSRDNHTCEDIDECAVNNAGCSHTCLNTPGSAFCLCPDGFYLTNDWKTCQDVNECESDPKICGDDFRCENTLGSHECIPLPKKITKILQDEDYDAEDDDEDEDGDGDDEDNYDDEDEGITELPESGRCSEGFKKTASEECVDINECEPEEAAQYHGCDHDCVNEPGGYHCTCRPGWAIQKDGATCQDIDECSKNSSICLHICKNTKGSYECQCPLNYTLRNDDRTCEKSEPVDTCSGLEHPCSHDCEDTEAGPICKCRVGYKPVASGKLCVDINECLENSTLCSHICKNTEGSYECECPAGYTLKDDKASCREIEPVITCSNLEEPCSQDCEDTELGPICKCRFGYELTQDLKNCQDVNECASDSTICSHICKNTEGSYECQCPEGYNLKEDNKTCWKIDAELKCSSLEHPCPQDCEDTPTGPVCKCMPGYEVAGGGSCQDIDECARSSSICSHICENTEGSYKCQCPVDYSLRADSRTCEKIEQSKTCSSLEPPCSHACEETDDGPVCNCPFGYELSEDNSRLCKDIDECARGICSHSCINLEGSFVCSCPHGLRLAGSDTLNCTDVNECEIGSHRCEQDCLNVHGTYECSCRRGFVLRDDGRTCNDVDECESDEHDCSHDCVNTPGSYSCECPDGAKLQSDGLTCEDIECPDGLRLDENGDCQDIDECAEGEHECSQNCVNEHGTYSCRCPPGFEIDDGGFHCKAVNACVVSNSTAADCNLGNPCDVANNRCSHTCENDGNQTRCGCPEGYEITQEDEKNCQDVDECTEGLDECSHICNNTKGAYTCDCPEGYELQEDRRNCRDIDECGQGTHNCSHECVNFAGGFWCNCPETLALDRDNKTCRDIDECALGRHNCSYRCVNVFDGYKCECPAGYRLQTDGRNCDETPLNGCQPGFALSPKDDVTCEDVDECADANEIEKACSHVCVNTPGSFYCQCPLGFKIGSDNKTCEDVNECVVDNGGCSHLCANTEGAVECACPEGHRLLVDDGKTCVEIDECLIDNGGCSHGCIYDNGTITCTCPTGMFLDDTDSTQCIEGNPCLDGNFGCSHICNYLNETITCACPGGMVLSEDDDTLCVPVNSCTDDNGGCSDICRFDNGKKSCGCSPGYIISSVDDKTCIDVDECTLGTHGCKGKCRNTVGSYECSCQTGFAVNPKDTFSCEDVDECSVENGGCSDICVNVPGSFYCSCEPGHTLSPDKSTCVAVDPCKNANGNCSHSCHYDHDQSIAKCSCPDGYRLTWDQKTCEDIDECEEFENDIESGCSHDCVNLQGGYRCECPTGYILLPDNKRTCVDLNECLSGDHNCSHSCLNLLGSYICTCYVGHYLHSDSRTCNDIDECQERNGGCSHECKNEVGGHLCFCPSGLELSRDQRVCIDVDECHNGVANCSHDCLNTLGSWKCICPDGHMLRNDSQTCEQVQRCDIDNGRCSHACFNVPTGVRCSCPMGLVLSDDNKTCEDANECLVDNGGCSHTCRNTGGSYRCECPPGHVLEDKSCRLQDPCQKNNGGCEQSCKNDNGSAICSCGEGYRVHHTNKLRCSDIDECSGAHGCQYSCINTIGSYECTCGPGFQSANNSCIDIDECASPEACSEGSNCINTHGSFRCECKTGFFGDGNNCVDVNECQRNNGGCSHDCRNTLGSYTCLCPTGFAPNPRNASHCQDVNECLTLKGGGCNGDCVNTPGSYHCVCADDLVLAPDERTCVSPQGKSRGVGRCSPLEPPVHGEVRCPGHSSAAVDYPQGARCYVRCRRHYKLEGAHTRYCMASGKWNGRESVCIRDTLSDPERRYYTGSSDVSTAPRPFVRCPADVDAELPGGASVTRVSFPQPKSNMDWWRYVDASPPWGKQLQADLPSGTTVVTFTARSPISNYTSSCRVVIRIRDAQNPRVFTCPTSFEVRLNTGERSRLIFWQEPTFTDNVRVERVWKSREPGQLMYPGDHNVRYIASDPAGNRAECHFSVRVREPERLQDSKPRTYRRLLMCPGRAPQPISATEYRWQIPSGCYLRYTRIFSGAYAIQQRYTGAGQRRDKYQAARAAYHEIHPIQRGQHSSSTRPYPLADSMNEVVIAVDDPMPMCTKNLCHIVHESPTLFQDSGSKSSTMGVTNRRKLDTNEPRNLVTRTVVMHYPIQCMLNKTSNSDLNVELTSMRKTFSTPMIRASLENLVKKMSSKNLSENHDDIDQPKQGLQKIYSTKQKTCLPLERSSPFVATNAQLPIIDISSFDYDAYRHKLIETSLKRQYGDRQAPGNVVLNSIHLNSIGSQTGIELSETYSHSLFDFIEEYYDATTPMSTKEKEYLHPLDHFLVKGTARPSTADRSTETKGSNTELDQVPELIDFRDQPPFSGTLSPGHFDRRRVAIETTKNPSKITVRSRRSSSLPRTSSKSWTAVKSNHATGGHNSSPAPATQQLFNRAENLSSNVTTVLNVAPKDKMADRRALDATSSRTSRSRTPRGVDNKVANAPRVHEVVRKRASSIVQGKSSNESLTSRRTKPREHSEPPSTDRDDKESLTCLSGSSSEVGSSCSSKPLEKPTLRPRASSLSSKSRTGGATVIQTKQRNVSGSANISFDKSTSDTRKDSTAKIARAKLSLRPRSINGRFDWDVPDVPGNNSCAVKTAGQDCEMSDLPTVVKRPRTVNPVYNRRRSPEKGKFSDTVLPVLESVIDLRVDEPWNNPNGYGIDDDSESPPVNPKRTSSQKQRAVGQLSRSKCTKISTASFVKASPIARSVEVEGITDKLTMDKGPGAHSAESKTKTADKPTSRVKPPAVRPVSASRLPVHISADKMTIKKLLQEPKPLEPPDCPSKLLKSCPESAEKNVSSVVGRKIRPRTAGCVQPHTPTLSPEIELSLEALPANKHALVLNEVTNKIDPENQNGKQTHKKISAHDTSKIPSRSLSQTSKKTKLASRGSANKIVEAPIPFSGNDERPLKDNGNQEATGKKPFLRAHSGKYGAPKLNVVEQKEPTLVVDPSSSKKTVENNEKLEEMELKLPTEGSKAALVMRRELKTYIKKIKLVLSKRDKNLQVKDLASLSITEAIVPELRDHLSPREIQELQGLLDRVEKQQAHVLPPGLALPSHFQ